MKLSRRELFTYLSWAASIPVMAAFLGKTQAKAANKDRWNEHPATLYFQKLGYDMRPGQSLVTEDSFNGGVRFDESTVDGYPAGQTMNIQNCIRMEDVNAETGPEILPYFHILAVSLNKPADRGHILNQTIEFLGGEAGLDPGRLAFISTPYFDPYIPELLDSGISSSQIVMRPVSEALDQGDGSGYFAPKGHPHAQPIYTVSIHYATDPALMHQDLSYPLPGFIELAEVMIEPESSERPTKQFVGFGLERVLMAMGQHDVTPDTARQHAISALEEEARLRNVPLPPAYHILKPS